MSCKHTEVPIVPGTLLPEDGPEAGTTRGANAQRRTRVEVRTRADTSLQVVIEGLDDEWIWVRVGESRVPLKVLRQHGTIGLVLPSGRVVVPAVGPTGPLTEVVVAGRSLYVSPRRVGSVAPALPEARTGQVAARMAGRVVRVRVAVGDRVTKGQPLLVLEAMKMEDEVRAPRDGTVTAILVGEGDRVERDGLLVELD
jgi:biotin carboxyl carrier protein